MKGNLTDFAENLGELRVVVGHWFALLLLMLHLKLRGEIFEKFTYLAVELVHLNLLGVLKNNRKFLINISVS